MPPLGGYYDWHLKAIEGDQKKVGNILNAGVVLLV